MNDEMMNRLKNVIDPELGVNIVDLGLIYEVKREKSTAVVLMTLTTPGCPMSPFFEAVITAELKRVKGVKKVKINLTFDPMWDPSLMKPEVRKALGF